MHLKIYDTGHEVTVIFLTGYGNTDKEEQRFEWEKTSKDFKENRIFVRDVRRGWYHDSFKQLIAELETATKGKKILAVGASMGGYAALVVAHVFKGSAIAFSPQVNLKIDWYKINDGRWIDNIESVNKITRTPEYLDMSFLEGEQYQIYYPSEVPIDAKHATMIKGKLFPIAYGDHNLAGYLKSKGQLIEIIRSRLEEINGKTN